MATNFFSQFPKLSYDIDGEGSYVNLTDISRTVDITNLNEDKVSYYTYYDIVDGDRPDTISQLLYKTPQHYWSLFILNDSLKAGINNAWPLSALVFETMIGTEYDKYSSFCVNPELTNIDSIRQQHSDFSIVPLDDRYLPYLFLTSLETQLRANILRYDRRLLQAVIYNITPYDGGVTAYANTSSLDLRNTFLNSSEYILQWINPYNSVTQSAAYADCQTLKEDWIDAAIVTFQTADADGPNVGYNGIAAGLYTRESYIFNKRYMSVGSNYTWPLYRNSPYQYYSTDDEGNIMYENAYDVITKQNSNYPQGSLKNTAQLTTNGITPLVVPILFPTGTNGKWTDTGLPSINMTGTSYILTCLPSQSYTTLFAVYVNGVETYSWEGSESSDPRLVTDLGSLGNNTGHPLFVDAKVTYNFNYISNYEKETLENDAKRKIKVVRPDKIRDFSKTYFTVLNS